MPFGNILLNDGNRIPAIAFGTGSVWKLKDVTKYVAQAIETGFCHIDTATQYNNEDSVGRAIRESGVTRQELYITTKYGVRGDPEEEIRKSLNKLGLKHVDLYLIHFPSWVAPDFENAWKVFQKIRAEGLTTSIGVSNFHVEHLEKMAKDPVKPAVNQINLHPYNYVQMKPVLEYCAARSIVVETYGSLAPITKYPGGPVDAPLAAAAQRRGASLTQIIMLWVKSKGAVIVTTSSSKEHLGEYMAVADLPPLTDDEIAAIEDAGATGPPSPLKVHISKVLRTFGKSAFLLGMMFFLAFRISRYHLII